MNVAMGHVTRPVVGSADVDGPRDGQSAEIIGLASRNAYPGVSQRKGKSDALGPAAGVAVIALMGVATFWALSSSRIKGDLPRPQLVPQQIAPTSVPQAARLAAPTSFALAPLAQPASRPGPILAAPPQGARVIDPSSSPMLVFDASALAPPAPGPAAAEATKGDAVSDFASRIGGVGGGPAQGRSDFNPQTTITQGTMIPAILETAIDTDVPGYVRAAVSQDVRSFDGSRVLVARSSRLIGQYQSGMQGGQKRAYVVWTRLIRPDGVSVALASPATGFDGSTGLKGDVNGHFFQRFGSALLLSVVSGLSALGSGGTGLVLGGGESAAAAAVGQGNRIGPTVRVHPGEPIRVFTARDLDFSRAP